MKGKWMRKMAIALSLCLILNSGFLDLAGYVYAATTESAQILNTETTTDSLDTEKSSADISDSGSDSNSDSSSGSSDSDSDETPDEGNGAGDDSGNNNDSGSGNDTDGNIGDNSGSTTGDGSNSDGNDSTDDTTESSSSDVTEGTTVETTTTEESTTEEETTTEELTTEEFTTEELPAAVALADTETSNVTIPDNIDDYKKLTSNELYINTLQDLINLQTLSADTDFEGKTIILSDRQDATSNIYDTSESSSFVGIGTEAYPFAGTFKGYYQDNIESVTLKLSAPLFQYLGTGADVSGLYIVANGCCSPIATHIKKSPNNSETTVNLSNIVVTDVIETKTETGEIVETKMAGIGTGGNETYGVAGTLAGTIWPYANVVVSNFNSTADISAKTAGGVCGIMYTGATITLSDDVMIGTEESEITVVGSYTAGGIWGSIAGECTLDLEWLDQVYVKVGDGSTNGFFGQLVGIIITSSEATSVNKLILTGKDTVEANVFGVGTCGGLVGYCENSIVELPTELSTEADSFTVTGTIQTTSNGYAGGIIGICKNGSILETSDIPLSITAAVSSESGTTGGVFGALINSSMDLKNITVEGAIRAGESGTAGGVFGEITQSAMKLSNLTVTENGQVSGNKVGGLIGLAQANGTKLIVDTPTIEGSLESTNQLGGLFGEVLMESVVELQGTIKVKGNLSGTRVGSIAAKQDYSLIYLNGVQGKNSAGESQLDVPMEEMTLDVSGDVSLPKYDEVYENGGVFRNQDMGNNILLIGNGSLEGIGIIHNTISGGNLGTDGETDAVADLETFAIANYTRGKFGLDAFGVSSLSDILDDSYILYSNADISYDTTGIISLNCNFPISEGYQFSGNLSGNGTDIVITQNSNVIQEAQGGKVGVFSYLTGANTFSNLTIQGTIRRATNVGGLAYSTSGTSLTLKGITVKKIFENISDVNYDVDGDGSLDECGIGGILVSETGSSLFELNAEDLTLASWIEAGTISDFSGFITTMEKAKVSLSNIKLGGRLASYGSTTAGGFLGKTWTAVGGNVGGTIKSTTGITIVEETAYDGLPDTYPTTYSSNAQFGCMLYLATSHAECGRLIMQNVDLANLNVTADAGVPNTSLLIYNGTDLVVEVIDYSASGATVTNAPTTFDEVMGTNVIDPYQRTFGVVSLHSTEANFPKYHYDLDFTDTKRHATYVGGSVPTMNSNTRYYYDVFQHLDAEITEENKFAAEGEYYVIDSPAKYLLWDITQCFELRDNMADVFSVYFKDGIPGNWGIKYYLRGDLNLTNYSVYPVSRQGACEYIGQQDAKITFAAAGMEEWELPNNEKSQHYMLHSGFLYSTYNGKITVDNVTFAGSIACNDPSRTGVLVAGNLNGDGEFTNITLNNLYISSYKEISSNDSTKNGASLLIGNIPASTESTAAVKTVVFDGIKMTGYTENAGWVGASLINYAGNKDGTNLVLKFHDMVMEHNKRTSDKYGTVLKYSTFLYEYYYTSDASINKGSGIYLFSKQDTLDDPRNVTYGAELDFETEYSDSSEKVFVAGVDPSPETVYIPYVYIQDSTSVEKQIQVNPKSGDILKGCGTYEDPYIIETYKQFLTLYSYINEAELVPKADGTMPDYKNQSLYEGWKVIRVGTDAADDFCSKKHVAALTTSETATADIVRTVTVKVNGVATTYSFTGTGADDVRVFGETDFPTPDELSRAYYQLAADIDLSGIQNTTYSVIAKDFVGFGTLERPFTGVWYGKSKDDEGKDVIHTVTLPDKADNAIHTTYGFIQYAQGAVVKDMIIESPFDEDDTTRLVTKINNTVDSAGGSVIACILGGDNIIDGVTSKVSLQNVGGVGSVGGYVGVVKKGGLILRNMTDASLSEYMFTTSGWIGNSNRGIYGIVAGKVEDGYVVYDDEDAGSDSYLYEGKGGNTLTYVSDDVTYSYDQVGNYQILNGYKLKTDCSGFVFSITDTSGATGEKDISITIPSAAGLQVMSMAMNANAFNVMPSDDTAYSSGYTELSRSRKAAYDKIGNCASVSEADYVKAAAYDNANGYVSGDYSAEKAYAFPYLFQYMGIENAKYLDYVKEEYTKESSGESSGDYSILNASDAVNGIKYHIFWNLIENGTYDMRVFNTGTFDAFRGIGGLYYPANVNGNTVTNIAGSSFRGDFDGNGSTILLDMERWWNAAEDYLGTAATAKRVGLFNSFYAPISESTEQGIYNHLVDMGIVNGATVKRPCYKISDFSIGGTIEVSPVSGLTNTANAGGVVSDIATGDYVFESISIAESAPLTIGKANSDYVACAGGLVGRVGADWNLTRNRVLIQKCNWKSSTSGLIKSKSHAGGFVGESAALITHIKDSSIDNLTVQSNAASAGGFVGNVDQSAGYFMIHGSAADGASVKNSSITGCQRAGGMFGQAETGVEISNILSEGNTVSAHYQIGGVAGILSHEKYSNFYNVNVKDLVTSEIAIDKIREDEEYAGIGGIVGKSYHTLLIENASVMGTDDPLDATTFSCNIHGVAKARKNSSGAVGGLVGYTIGKPLTLRDCEVYNASLKIYTDTSTGTVYTASLMVGGLVGLVEGEVMLDGTVKTSYLNVETPQQKEMGSKDYPTIGAGGCFGRIKGSVVGGYRTTTATVYYKGLTAEKNIINGKNAGGICGYVENGTLRLHGTKVKGGELYGDSTAGGFLGYVMQSSGGIGFNEERTYASEDDADKNVVSGVKITGCLAGGVIGHAFVNASRIRMENFTVEDCVIHGRKLWDWSKDSAGGLMGAVSFGVNRQVVAYGVKIDGNTIVCENKGTTIASGKIIYPAVGGLVGRSVNTNNVGSFFCDLLDITSNNQIGMTVVTETTNEDGTTTTEYSDAKLIQWNSDSSVYELVDVELPANVVLGDLAVDGSEWKNYNAVDSLVQKYGYCVGSIVGVADTNLVDFYIWKSKDENNLFNNPVMVAETYTNTPVTDVGFNEADEMNPESEKYFRNSVHVVYGAPVTAVTDEVGGDTYHASDPVANLAYMKMRVKEADTAYAKESTSFESLLTSYRLSKKDVDLFNASYQESYGIADSGFEITEPLLVLKTENGTIQESMERITNIMTNVAGNSASDIDEAVLSIETKQYVVKDGDVSVGSGTPSLKASIKDGEVTYTSSEYDSATEDGITYTEITFTYSMPDTGHQKIFKLNIYVEEPIMYGVHTKIMEGSVTSVDEIKEKGLLGTAEGTSVVIANDSAYTLLMEYSYGQAREKMSDQVITEKAFRLESSNGQKVLAVGTKLRLIDVTHGNVPYYYTVTEEEVTEVKFSDFKDSTGKSYYVNQPICDLSSEGEAVTDDDGNTVYTYTDLAEHTLENTGVERYLLTVFNEDTTEMAYEIHTDFIPQIMEADGARDATEAEKSQFMPLKEHEELPWFKVSAILGLNISLKTGMDSNKKEYTSITGKISKDDTVTVRATYVLEASGQYWNLQKNSNSLDSENNGKYLELAFYLRDGSRISLPEGTNVSFIETDEDGNTVYSENTVIKDGSILYYYKDIEGVKNPISDLLEMREDGENTIEVTIEFKLDFSNADLSELNSSKYEAWIELLRTANSQYPMGSGNMLDSYNTEISAQASNNLGFAIQATDLNQLAINTYPAAETTNTIDYQTMFDFSDILEKISGDGKDQALEKWAGYEYEVTYTLYQKQVQKQTSESGETTNVISYVKYTGDEIKISVADEEASTTPYTYAYKFSEDEIEDGLIVKEGTMTISTADLVEEQANLTNYKIIATLKIRESENASSDEEAATEDFFVFTVTKLKTDLSE